MYYIFNMCTICLMFNMGIYSALPNMRLMYLNSLSYRSFACLV